jgi:GTPase SAR1 family protein
MQRINVVKIHRMKKMNLIFLKFSIFISSNLYCKLVLIGDAAVGKSSLARRLNKESKID